MDAGGRVSKYDYDLKLLLGGTAGCTINFLDIVGKLIANLTGLDGSPEYSAMISFFMATFKRKSSAPWRK